MVKDKLTAPLEQVEQAHFPFGAVENILLVDEDHRQPAALRGKRVESTSHRFLFREYFFLAACHSPGETIRGIDLLRFVLIFILPFIWVHHLSLQNPSERKTMRIAIAPYARACNTH
jgi:hypothetical protein